MISFPKLNWDKSILLICFFYLIILFIGAWFKMYYFLVLPIAFLIAILYFFKPDYIWYSVALLVPLSINPNDVELGNLSLSLPTEPMLVLLMLGFFYILFTSEKVDKKVLSHPISWLIYIYFLWLLITSFMSSDKVVSLKFCIAKAWFIIPSYFLASIYIKERKNFVIFICLFTASMVFVALFNTIHLSMFNFEDKPSQWTMQPFFKDHTILGALLALTIPLMIGIGTYFKEQTIFRPLFWACYVILIIGVGVTYSRAAWVSVVPALAMYLFLVFRLRFNLLFTVLIVSLGILFYQLDDILMELQKNKVASSDDVVENVESVSNINNDPSNLERINRWACALDMWQTKPIFGFGPGTFMFEYAPYQRSANYTAISTNFGDVGNAHSEYLGPLAETGLFGLLIMLGFLFLVYKHGLRAYYNAKERGDRVLIATALCALITYFVHGFLNNFLDTDKAAVIFWTLISFIVVMDVKLDRRIFDNQNARLY